MIVGRVGIIGAAGWLGSAIAQSLVSSGTVDPPAFSLRRLLNGSET